MQPLVENAFQAPSTDWLLRDTVQSIVYDPKSNVHHHISRGCRIICIIGRRPAVCYPGLHLERKIQNERPGYCCTLGDEHKLKLVIHFLYRESRFQSRPHLGLAVLYERIIESLKHRSNKHGRDNGCRASEI